MITISPTSRLGHWFVWCNRRGADYVEFGTTLCHVAWVTFWAPLICAAFVGTRDER